MLTANLDGMVCSPLHTTTNRQPVKAKHSLHTHHDKATCDNNQTQMAHQQRQDTDTVHTHARTRTAAAI